MSQTNGLNGAGTPKRPIRLLEVIGNAITGGMETYVRNLIANLPSDGFEVTCLCPYESAYTASLRALGCRVYVTPLHDDPMWRAIEMAGELVRQNGIDLIHANLANAHTLAGVVSGLTGVPAVATIHSRNLGAQEISVTRLASTHLITVCQEAQMQALAAGLPDESVSLIRNGVDTGRFRPGRNGAAFRDAIGVGPDTLLVGFVGRLSWEKGPDKFLNVAGRIRQQLPDVRFVMVGDGPAEPEIRNLVHEMGLGDCVHVAGLREDVEDIYPALDLFVQTSRSEAMPLALLEAMASGVPVVAIAVGGVAELVEAGTTGLLVSPGDWPGVSSRYPGDWEGVACAAIDLLRQPARMIAMGAASRRRVQDHFDLTRCVDETGRLFRRLAISEGRRNPAGKSITVLGEKGDGDRRVRLKAGTIQNTGHAQLAAVRANDPS
jgi:glycosyltransferase involved in cell wall biosynthesis